MSQHVFVYGTLLFEEVTTKLSISSQSLGQAGRAELRRCDAILKGYERLTVRLRKAGNYPAIIPSELVSTPGQVLRDLTDESLAILDRFEGVAEGYYLRKRVSVEIMGATGTKIDAFAYVCGDVLRSYLDGPWDPDEFRRNDLEQYLI